MKTNDNTKDGRVKLHDNTEMSLARFILLQLRDVLIALVFSALVSYMFIGNSLFRFTNDSVKGLLFGFLLAMLMWKGNQLIEWLVRRKFPWEKNPKKTFLIDVIFSVGYVIVAVILLNWGFYGLLYDYDIFSNFGTFWFQILIEIFISLLITMGFYLFFFVKWLTIYRVNEERLKKESLELKFDVLRKQVDPHFLFNSLSVLSSLIETDKERALEFISQFSDIYRYVLSRNEQELVPLAEELGFARSFINLNRIRHGSKLNVEWNVNDKSGYLIPLSLQLLLENCFKHNVISTQQPLFISIIREGNYLSVSNKRQPKPDSTASTGLGLDTIRKRYAYLSDIPVIVDYSDNLFTVKLPVLYIQ